MDEVTNFLKIESDCRPGAIAQSLALQEPKYQETAAYCHFGRQPESRNCISKLGTAFLRNRCGQAAASLRG